MAQQPSRRTSNQQSSTLPIQQYSSFEDEQPSAPSERAQAAQAAPPAPAAAADPNDPWSSLQSTYRIKDGAAAGGAPGRGESYGGSRGGSRGADPGQPKEVLVLGDDDVFSGGHGRPMNNTNRTSGYGGRSMGASIRSGVNPPGMGRPPARPQQGGWGNGELAQAGDLMVGGLDDDWLENDKPPDRGLAAQLPAGGFGGGGGGGGYDHDDYHAPPPKAAQGKQHEVMCEDIEDVDALLEDELQDGAPKKK
ncbi:hypothetical protein HYH03_005913 [Edaphochlamys debaryana]|nr:hypothetical protein HYH03_005913 [Edaphochlamys debaryana]|eukprot:KAG2495987.1 hypothetical protein HYH03_005913 [Edaphochlamys debaryana]